jgi:hypothetical protein
MKERNNANSLAQFFKFLTTDDSRFRQVVFYRPLVTAIGAGIVSWFVFQKGGIGESLLASAGTFLFLCFFGLVYEATKRRNLR